MAECAENLDKQSYVKVAERRSTDAVGFHPQC